MYLGSRIRKFHLGMLKMETIRKLCRYRNGKSKLTPSPGIMIHPILRPDLDYLPCRAHAKFGIIHPIPKPQDEYQAPILTYPWTHVWFSSPSIWPPPWPGLPFESLKFAPCVIGASGALCWESFISTKESSSSISASASASWSLPISTVPFVILVFVICVWFMGWVGIGVGFGGNGAELGGCVVVDEDSPLNDLWPPKPFPAPLASLTTPFHLPIALSIAVSRWAFRSIMENPILPIFKPVSPSSFMSLESMGTVLGGANRNSLGCCRRDNSSTWSLRWAVSCCANSFSFLSLEISFDFRPTLRANSRVHISNRRCGVNEVHCAKVLCKCSLILFSNSIASASARCARSVGSSRWAKSACGGYDRSSRGAVVAMAQETRHRWNSPEKWALRAWYCCSSGGRMDQDVEVVRGMVWWSVGGGGRQWSVSEGKSRVRGS